MLLILAVIVICLEKAVCSLTQQEKEMIFFKDIIQRQTNVENPLCGLTSARKTAFCHQAYQMPLFTTLIQAEFNKIAFHQHEPHCSKQIVTFRTFELQNAWEQIMIPCFGRHRIPRTSWNEDPFLQSFLFTLSIDSDNLYIFGEQRSGEEDKIYLIEVVKVIRSGLSSLKEIIVTPEGMAREAYLYSIEAHTTNIREVEALYVRDIIRNEAEFPNPFETMEVGKLLTVCLSIFTEHKYARRGISISREAMFASSNEALQVQNSVYFQLESQRDGHPQKTYSCLAEHPRSSSFVQTVMVASMYTIAAGRKPNSIFVFEILDIHNRVRLFEHIENFDFAHLRPSEPSEKEIYADTERLLQVIQYQGD